MEDENTKEENQPSTSRKESQRTNSGNDLYDERGHDDRASNTETSVSATYSVRSRIDMADARPEVPKATLGKREPKAPERKKRRRVGRVEKRRRSFTRRQVRRAPPKRKPRVAKEERKDRDLSVSTIFTRLSSRSSSRTPGCIHCGHRCCRRRAKRFVVRYQLKQRRLKLRRQKLVKKKTVKTKKKKRPRIDFARQCKASASQGSKQIQIGSRSQMLSPLFVDTNSILEEEHMTYPPQTHCQVTPEMIYEALRALILWKQEVPTVFIIDYIRRKYPVNSVERELFIEMREKLRIAALVGIVVQTRDELWTLSCELQQRKLTANHVTLFWQAYADTLSPLPKNNEVTYKERTETQTNTARYKGPAEFCDELV